MDFDISKHADQMADLVADMPNQPAGVVNTLRSCSETIDRLRSEVEALRADLDWALEEWATIGHDGKSYTLVWDFVDDEENITKPLQHAPCGEGTDDERRAAVRSARTKGGE